MGGSSRAQIDYAQRLDEREEGGTPSIIGDLRAGVAFLLEGDGRTGPHPRARARARAARASSASARHPRITVYGPADEPRLAILSFNIEGLHHDFVSTLLDHLFGIQNRAGLLVRRALRAPAARHRVRPQRRVTAPRSRAGVLGHQAGLGAGLASVLRERGRDRVRARAIEFVADRGDAFLPLYRLGWSDGIWRHIEQPMRDTQPIELTPEALREAAAKFGAPSPEWHAPGPRRSPSTRYLEEANGSRTTSKRVAAASPPNTARRRGSRDRSADLVRVRGVRRRLVGRPMTIGNAQPTSLTKCTGCSWDPEAGEFGSRRSIEQMHPVASQALAYSWPSQVLEQLARPPPRV